MYDSVRYGHPHTVGADFLWIQHSGAALRLKGIDLVPSVFTTFILRLDSIHTFFLLRSFRSF